MRKNIFKKIFFGNFFVNIPSKEYLLDIIYKQLTNNQSDQKIIFYLNSASYYYQSENRKTKDIFNSTNYVYLNSFYIGLAIKILYRITLQKLNAEDFIYDIFDFCVKNNKKIYILGARKETMQKALINLKKTYTSLMISGHHGYFSSDHPVIKEINNFVPDLLIVGLGSGNQENWIYKNKTKLKKINVIITVGNFIDILGGVRKLPPKWMRQYQLEWLYRLFKEPKKLYKRYLVGGALIFKQFIDSYVDN